MTCAASSTAHCLHVCACTPHSLSYAYFPLRLAAPRVIQTELLAAALDQEVQQRARASGVSPARGYASQLKARVIKVRAP